MSAIKQPDVFSVGTRQHRSIASEIGGKMTASRDTPLVGSLKNRPHQQSPIIQRKPGEDEEFPLYRMLMGNQSRASQAFQPTQTSHMHVGSGRLPFNQTKLSINTPGDSFEHEADAMADKVMRMKDPFVPSSRSDTIFKPVVASSIQRKCQQCEEEERHIHRKESTDLPIQGSNELDNYVGSLDSSGHALSEDNRQFFEPRFGQDFSNVRLHTDSIAAKSAQAINALAYTTGNHIVFNQGQYAPGSESGQRLMAHELTHVVQQNEGSIHKKIIQRSERCDEEGNCVSIDDGIQATIVDPGVPSNQQVAYSGSNQSTLPEQNPSSSNNEPTNVASPVSAAAASLGPYKISKRVASDLRATAREGAIDDLTESVESGTYSEQSLYTAERFTPDQLVDMAENGVPSDVQFSHLESLSSSPQFGAESDLGVLTDKADHLYGQHGGNYSNDPGEFSNPDWETRPESEELFGDSNMQIVDGETQEGMDYLGGTDSAADVGADVATDVGTDVAADVGTDVALDVGADVAAEAGGAELADLLLLLLL